MAKLEWKYPIEAVHGALKKKVFGAAKRKSANAKGDQPNFSVNYGQRTTEPSDDEKANRLMFSAVSKLVAQHRNSPTSRVTDQAAFKAQTAYKTLTSYLWATCKAQYEASLEED